MDCAAAVFSPDFKDDFYRDDKYELSDSAESQSGAKNGGCWQSFSLPDWYKNQPTLCKVNVDKSWQQWDGETVRLLRLFEVSAEENSQGSINEEILAKGDLR